ncbi:MFS transporter [Actinoplanes couchii]|uniref:MFS transporter n=1 Tax=Actinoplanes couchii TaxID=403638 RepID=A0ABQ3XSK4_9ACTN|nr:MFS transporter [Actinoplanes couchii]MDR6317948.1 MFS family permease [Actinoplanes couchii]GID61357.1 MFS transporter [Actinoplanes couchii]
MNPPPRPTMLLIAAAASSFLLSMIQSIPVPVLPQIAHQLGVDATTAGWVTTSTLLAASACTPLLGRLGHVYGIKPVFIAALLITLVGSVITATVHDIGWLIFGRVLQGASMGLFPLGISLLRHELPAARLTGSMAIVASTLGVGGGVALVAAGLLAQGDGDYRRAFAVSVVVGLIALALACTLPRRPGGGGRVDWTGAAVLSAGLISLLLPISQGHSWGWTSPGVLGLFVVAVLILTGFLLFERRTAAPLVSVTLLSHRPVLVTNLAAMAVGFAMFATNLATSYLVQIPRETAGFGFGASVLETSIVFLLPGAAVSIIVGPLSGRLVNRIGARLVLVIACVTSASSSISLAVAHQGRAEVIVAFVLLSCGTAMAYAAMPALLISHVDPHDTSIANSINSIMRTIGGTVGSALVITILSVPTQSAFRISYVMSAVVFAAGAAMVLLLIRRPAPVPEPVLAQA